MIRNTISIGVQAACMIACEARVPLMVFAKLHGFKVKDPVDLAIVRQGRLIHEAFESAATRLSSEGRITDSAAVVHELTKEITISLPELDTAVIEQHAIELTTAITNIARAEPTATIAHEKRVSVLLSPRVKLSGRIDTITGDVNGRIIIERKSGEEYAWHKLQVQLYAAMLLEKEPDASISRLELWYS